MTDYTTLARNGRVNALHALEEQRAERLLAPGRRNRSVVSHNQALAMFKSSRGTAPNIFC